MAKKSRMVREHKKLKAEWNEKRQQSEEQTKALQDAQTGRLLLREFLPPCIKGLEKFRDHKMATIAEIRTSSYHRRTSQFEHSEPTPSVCIWPQELGQANLLWFQHYWETQMPAAERKLAELGTPAPNEPMSSEQLQARIAVERLKAVDAYLEELLELAEYQPALPICRSETTFLPCDKVQCFIPKDERFAKWYQHTFIPGTVTQSVAKNSDTVTVHLYVDAMAAFKTNQHDCEISFPLHSMNIISEKDYQYLQAHSTYRRDWLHLSAATEGDPQKATEMNDMLAHEQIRDELGDYEWVAHIMENSGKM